MTVLTGRIHETPFVEKDLVIGTIFMNHHVTGRWNHETRRIHETPFVEKDQVIGTIFTNHHVTGRWIHETPIVRVDQVISRTIHHVTGTSIVMTTADP